MRLKTNVPETLKVRLLPTEYNFGKSKKLDELYIKFESRITHWGVLKSYRAKGFYKGKLATTLRTDDMGVKLYKGSLRLSFQTHDTAIQNDPQEYIIEASFDFMAELVGIDWPIYATRKPAKRSKKKMPG